MRMQSSDAVVMREEPFGGSAWGPELLFHCNGTTGFRLFRMSKHFKTVANELRFQRFRPDGNNAIDR
jgi:hypothetical protein